MSLRSLGAGPLAAWCGRVDCGAIHCSLQPESFKDVGQPRDIVASGQPPARAPLAASLTDVLTCADPAGPNDDLPLCCVPEDWDVGPVLSNPCMVCAVRPASIVEIPCGHPTVCMDCYGDYHTNSRCLRCRGSVLARVDVSPFLDSSTGWPSQCRVCRSRVANVVMVPCVHMCLCENCLPNAPAGCPTCGETVERTCVVKWAVGENNGRPGARHGHRRDAGRGQEGPLARRSLTDNEESAGMAARALSQATEDVEEEILRLERQLFQLRAISRTTPSSLVSNPQDCRSSRSMTLRTTGCPDEPQKGR